jgi:hypothetical protein
MASVEVVRWLLAGLLGSGALYLSSLNWYALVTRMTKPQGPTWVPLVGGLLGVGATLLQPTGVGREYWWVPLVLDGGSIPGLSVTLVHLLRRRGTKP